MQHQFDWLWKLDPDQMQGLEFLQSSDHVLLSVQQQKQVSLIVAWAMENLLTGKKGYIVTGDQEMQEEICQQFNALDLAPVVYLKNARQYYPSLQLARKKQADGKELKSQQFAMATAQQKMKQWQVRYELLQTPVFNALTWRDLADRIAAHPLSGEPNILMLKLNPTEFERTADEYKMIRSKLSNYLKLCKLNHPWFDQLNELNITHLRQYSLDTIKKEVSEHLAEVTEGGEMMIRSGEILLLDFIQHAKQTLQSRLKDGYQKIAALLFKIENYQHFLGPEFALETSFSNFTLKLKSNFTRSSKDLVKARRWVKSAYMELLTDLSGLESYIPPSSLEPVETISMDAIRTHLHDLSNELKDCERKMQARINEQIKRLNSKNLHIDHPLHQRIKDWETRLQNWKDHLDTSQFLNIRKEVNALSVSKKLTLVTDIVRQLREMRRACAKLEDFFFWRSFEDNIPQNAAMVISALEFEEHHRWLDLFDQWYFLSTLEQHTLAEMPDSPEFLEIPARLSSSALKCATQFIKLSVQNDRHEYLRSMDQNARKIQRLARKRDETGTHHEIGQLNPDERFDLFPLQIVSPEQFTRTFGIDYTDGRAEVLYIIGGKHIELGNQLASGSRKSPCHIIASPDIAHRLLQTSQVARKVQFRFKRILSGDLSNAIPVDEVSSSEKLNLFKQVASLFEPVYRHMTIYNTKYVQLVSFLGPKLDAWMLDELEMPYKLHEEGLKPDAAFLVECLLDHKKPILILMRDGLFSPGEHRSVLWQKQVVNTCEQIRIPVFNTWTVDWMHHGSVEMNRVRELIFQHVPGLVQTGQSKSA